MRTLRNVFISISWILPGAALGASAGGTLSGVVVDGSGAPIGGAVVLYKSVPAIATAANGTRVVTGPRVASGIKTAADGSFAVSGLPPATYNLCAYGVNSADLGSCEWGQGTTRAVLASGQTAQFSFQVAQGTLLTFQVQDAQQQIKSLEDLQPTHGGIVLTGANFAIGVWAGSRYVRAGLVSASGNTRQYQVAIPKTAIVRLHLDTSLNVVDATGAAIPARQPSSTLEAGGQSEVTVKLTVP